MDIFVLANNICKFSKEQNITVERLAEALNKSPRQVNRYRNGQCKNISVVTLTKMANIFNVSVSELIS